MAKILPRICIIFFLAPSWLTGAPPDTFKVLKVVDGDTLLLSNGERVRLIGVDTPEVHTSNKLYSDAKRTGQDVKTIRELGRKSSEFVKKLVANQEVMLKFDRAPTIRNRRDRYGRLLAYVYFTPIQFEKPPTWLEEDVYFSQLYKKGFLNALIVYAGYGYAYTKYPFDHMEEFRGYAKSARESNRGLWKDK